jgi:hypothetical protein
MADKVYLGKTRVVTTSFGELTKLSFGPQDFEKMESYKNAEGWLNMEIKTSREGGLYLEIDTWKPEPSTQGNASNQTSDNLPF